MFNNETQKNHVNTCKVTLLHSFISILNKYQLLNNICLIMTTIQKILKDFAKREILFHNT